jgi:hypothetical protein
MPRNLNEIVCSWIRLPDWMDSRLLFFVLSSPLHDKSSPLFLQKTVKNCIRTQRANQICTVQYKAKKPDGAWEKKTACCIIYYDLNSASLDNSVVCRLWASIKQAPEPVFVNLFRSPGIDSQPSVPIRQTCLSYTGTPGYIGWGNGFLGIYSWAP